MKWIQIRLGVACCCLLITFNSRATTHYVDANGTNPVSPYADWGTAATNIQDAVDAALNGDQILVTNGIYQYGGGYNGVSNRAYVTKAIKLQSVNGPSVTVIEGGQDPSPVRCAYLVSGASLAGFTLTNGATGSISPNGAGVCCQAVGIGITSASVSNCIITGNHSWLQGGGAYSGTLMDCVIAGNSTGNTGVGAFFGGGACSSALYNCIIVSNTAVGANIGSGGGLSSCTASNCVLANNLSGLSGGGAFMSKLVDCVLTNNAVVNTYSSSAHAEGGGAFQGYLTNCIVANNSVSGGAYGSVYGGGGSSCYLVNCTIVGNSAMSPSGTSGGVYNCNVFNSIVYDNTAQTASNWSGGGIYYSCTVPLPTTGGNNITNGPLFINLAGGDLHLLPNSPCINAGNNTYVSRTNDLDGNPRISGGTVDVGAYEYQTPASVLSYAWAQQHGLPTDGSADNADADGDGMNNFGEWKAGTDPTNALSLLQLESPVFTNGTAGIVVTWQSVTNVIYYLQRSSDLSAGFSSIQSNLVGQAGFTSYTDTTATNGGPYFYRVGVQ